MKEAQQDSSKSASSSHIALVKQDFGFITSFPNPPRSDYFLWVSYPSSKP